MVTLNTSRILFNAILFNLMQFVHISERERERERENEREVLDRRVDTLVESRLWSA